MVPGTSSIPNRDATESRDRHGEGIRRRLIPLPVRRVRGHDVLCPLDRRLRDGRPHLTPVHSSAMHNTRSDPSSQFPPDFLDSRLKHAGMTRGTVVNCGIRVQQRDTRRGELG